LIVGAMQRRKGGRIEREIVNAHLALGIHAERYPYSGGTLFRGSGHDVDVYVNGKDKPPLVSEVKARKNGAGFTVLEQWLGNSDVLFLKRNNTEPLVVVPWRVYEALLLGIKRP
jgi:Holliday junction resolvase